MHQSVAEFIERDQVKKSMAECLKGHDFNANICIMRSCILELKHLHVKPFSTVRQPGGFLAHVWFRNAWPIIERLLRHAFHAEEETQKAAVDLISELDLVAGRIWQSYTCSEGRYYIPEGCHWSQSKGNEAFKKSLDSRGSLVALTAQQGLIRFVRSCIEGNVKDKKPTNSQLDYAISLLSSKNNPEHVDLKKLLLEARGFSIKAYIRPKLPSKLKVFARKLSVDTVQPSTEPQFKQPDALGEKHSAPLQPAELQQGPLKPRESTLRSPTPELVP